VSARFSGRGRHAASNKDDTMFATPAFAQAAGGGAASGLISFVPILLIFAIMYLLMIRPQQKKMKEHKAMIEALRRGDQVVTSGGLIGKVTKVADSEVEVEVAPNVKVRVVRSTISQVVNKTEPAEA
jgi:preprotein translocase subunit YajC